MSLLYLGTASSSSSTTTYNLASVPFGQPAQERYIVCGVTAERAAPTTYGIASATIGDVAADVIAAVEETTGGIDSYMIIAKTPSGSSGTVSITFNSGQVFCHVGLWRVTGIASATPFDTALAVGDPTTLSIDVPNNGIVIGVAQNATSGTVFATTGVTENYDVSFDGSRHVGGSVAGLSSQTGRVVTFNGASADCSGCCASWEMAPESLVVAASPMQPFLMR
jgi:hypothetical protein